MEPLEASDGLIELTNLHITYWYIYIHIANLMYVHNSEKDCKWELLVKLARHNSEPNVTLPWLVSASFRHFSERELPSFPLAHDHYAELGICRPHSCNLRGSTRQKRQGHWVVLTKSDAKSHHGNCPTDPTARQWRKKQIRSNNGVIQALGCWGLPQDHDPILVSLRKFAILRWTLQGK